MHRTTLPLLVLIGVLASGTIFASEQPPRQVAPATVTMQLPPAFGEMQRPPIEFDHPCGNCKTTALSNSNCFHRI